MFIRPWNIAYQGIDGPALIPNRYPPQTTIGRELRTKAPCQEQTMEPVRREIRAKLRCTSRGDLASPHHTSSYDCNRERDLVQRVRRLQPTNHQHSRLTLTHIRPQHEHRYDRLMLQRMMKLNKSLPANYVREDDYKLNITYPKIARKSALSQLVNRNSQEVAEPDKKQLELQARVSSFIECSSP